MSYSENKMRLQKYIAHSGYCSRRQAEKIIEARRVAVNGKIVKEHGVKVGKEDQVTIDGELILLDEKDVYYIVNKPKGVLSTAHDEFDRPTVVQGIPGDERIYPVGRLDKETTGALILTNDGEFTNYLTHPSYDVEKKYRVSVDGVIDYDVINSLRDGVTIDGVEYKGVKIQNINKDEHKIRSQLTITLHEGKNRQIRKIFDHFNLPVLKLHRFAIGSLEINELNIGEFRELKPFEVKKLLLDAKGVI